MAMSATSLTGSGLRDWIWQRISAIVLAIYFIFLMSFLVTHPQLNFETWAGLFENFWMKLASSMVIVFLIIHSWIGIWIVITDYVKPLWLRLSMQSLILFSLLGLLIWGLAIFWSV